MNIVAMLQLWLWSLLGSIPGSESPPPPPGDIEATSPETAQKHAPLWAGPIYINNGY